MSGGGAWEIEAVAAHIDADTLYFGLGGSNGGDHLGVGDFAVLGNGIFGNKEDGVGAGGMQVPTPWARRPKSLARALTQVAPSGSWIRC